MGKKRQKERFDILLFAAGLFCIGMTLWILISEISEYVQQKDWTAATAIVVDVSPHSGDYDVYYQYEAAGIFTRASSARSANGRSVRPSKSGMTPTRRKSPTGCWRWVLRRS